MPQINNNKAADLHEAAAKSHRSAAMHFGKKDGKAGLEDANHAKTQSDDANKASIVAHAKSVGAHT
jgi:hypothetical protein